MNRILTFLAVWMCAASVQAATLYAISGDDFGVPRRVNIIDTVAATVTPVIDLGDGSVGYFGLTFANNRFYTVANDAFGASTLHSFEVANGGTTDALFSLGAGFTGGLVAQSANSFFALAGDPFTGASALHAIDVPTMAVSLVDPALGFGAAGGLTYNSDDGLLYALGSDINFVQSLYSIDSTTLGSSTNVTGPLGQGVIGGVDYAGAAEGFFAIGNPFTGSQLLSVDVANGATGLFGLSPFQSYTFAGLTTAPRFDIPPMQVPAPGALMLVALGLVVLAALTTRRRRLAIIRA